MPRLIRQRPLQWGAIVGAVGALLAVVALTGCPGDIDPSIQMPTQGSGGSSGTGGSGNSSGNCTGSNAGDQLITTNCAIGGCHNSTSAKSSGAGLDLTIDSGIKTRLVGVTSTGTALSACGSNQTPYLNDNSNPATGLLIDKIQANPPCGVQMPLGGTLTADQQSCIIQWATTVTTQ